MTIKTELLVVTTSVSPLIREKTKPFINWAMSRPKPMSDETWDKVNNNMNRIFGNLPTTYLHKRVTYLYEGKLFKALVIDVLDAGLIVQDSYNVTDDHPISWVPRFIYAKEHKVRLDVDTA